jgi:hypothetical protein
MGGQMNVARQQRLFNLFGEQTLAAEFAQRLALDLIAGGGDDHDPHIVGGQMGMRLQQARFDFLGLG